MILDQLASRITGPDRSPSANDPSRRTFLRAAVSLSASVGGLAVLSTGCGLLLSRTPPHMVRIGWLDFVARETQNPPRLQWVREALSQYGWMEEQNFTLEYRSSDGHDERFADLAVELVKLPVDLFFVTTTPAALAAKQATTTVPIVFTSLQFPVQSGVVQSLARPGANVTGMAQYPPEMAGKRLSLLQEVVPGLTEVACLNDPESPAAQATLEELRNAAPQLGLQLQILDVRSEADLEPSFASARASGAEALTTSASAKFVIIHLGQRIVELAAHERLPAVYNLRHFPENGGLMSYGSSTQENYRRAAYYVDRILRGAKAAELPVEQPTAFEFVVNVSTARQLGLTFPPEVAAQVTEWIR